MVNNLIICNNHYFTRSSSSKSNYSCSRSKFIYNEVDQTLIDTEISYISIQKEIISSSDNLDDVIKYKDLDKLIREMPEEKGKFTYNNQQYYYYKIIDKNINYIFISKITNLI